MIKNQGGKARRKACHPGAVWSTHTPAQKITQWIMETFFTVSDPEIYSIRPLNGLPKQNLDSRVVDNAKSGIQNGCQRNTRHSRHRKGCQNQHLDIGKAVKSTSGHRKGCQIGIWTSERLTNRPDRKIVNVVRQAQLNLSILKTSGLS